MALSAYFANVDPMLSTLDRVFDRSLGRYFPVMPMDLAVTPTQDLFKHFGGTHPMDIVETDKTYELHCDAPGMSPEDIKVEVQDGVISISGQKEAKKEHKDETGKALRTERTFTSFSRSFAIPENAKEDEISASLDKGVLKVTLPKAEPAPKPEPKRIEVHAA